MRYFPAAAAIAVLVAAIPSVPAGPFFASPVGAVAVRTQATDTTATAPVPTADPNGPVVSTPPATTPPATTPPATNVPTTSAPTTTVPIDRFVVIQGRGFGHGRGLGQWGAFGYARDKGWGYRQILDHFYGGTVAGAVSPQSAIGVRLTALDGKALTVFQPKGRVYTAIEGQPGFTLPPMLAGAQSALAGLGVQAAVTVPPGSLEIAVPPTVPPLLTGSPGAVRIELVAGGFQISDGPACEGPWTARPLIATRSVTVSAGPADPTVNADDPSEMLHVCEAKNARRVYRGDLLAVDAKPGQKAVNLVGLDAYLRGVVPREIAASWSDAAMEAVKAQAVAARSYAAAEKRSSVSNTCDTTACQVYGGRGRYVGVQFTSLEDPRTDRAIAETANEIRVNPKTGVPIRTEFSASTGGHTAGGAFPAVADEGDFVTNNPNRSWTVRLKASRLEKGRKLGSLVTVAVATRDGFGDGGGRASKVVMTFAGGTASITGDELMRMFSLRSSWFDITVEADPAGTLESPLDTALDAALTGDAGAVQAAVTVPPTTLKPGSSVTPTSRKRTTKTTKLTGPTIVVAVAAGADPVKTVVGGEVVGTPTTLKKK